MYDRAGDDCERRKVDFLKKGGFCHYTLHAVFRGVGEKVPDDDAEKEINLIIFDVDLEEFVENYIKNREHEKRFQKTPKKSEYRAIVL